MFLRALPKAVYYTVRAESLNTICANVVFRNVLTMVQETNWRYITAEVLVRSRASSRDFTVKKMANVSLCRICTTFIIENLCKIISKRRIDDVQNGGCVRIVSK